MLQQGGLSVELVLIQQNDTHGCLNAHPEFFWGDPRPFYIHCGGFSRIFRYVIRLKQQHPHVLFVDGGDLFHGTGPLVLSKGEAVLPLLRQMPLDAWVRGNWDFAYGTQQLFSLISQVPAPALAMNAKPISGKVNPFHSHMIREIGGIRVGLTGWTYPFVDQTMPPSFSEGFTFSLNIDDMRKVVHQLREKERADLIVVISHMGLPLDIKSGNLH
jgi:sulfur-oxidizing protein SoxB